jgi:hypothetical protein
MILSWGDREAALITPGAKAMPAAPVNPVLRNPLLLKLAINYVLV